MKTNRKPFLQPLLSFFKKIQQRFAVALMATFISLCALGVSLYQTRLSRQQQLASVWPYLSIGGYGAADSTHQNWGIKVVNNGLGPAIIEGVELRLNGKAYPFQAFSDSLYVANAQLDSVKRLNYSINTVGKGTVLAAGAAIEWFSFEHQFASKPLGKTTSERFLSAIGLSIRYKSLYNEQWESCFNCDGKEEDEVRKLD